MTKKFTFIASLVMATSLVSCLGVMTLVEDSRTVLGPAICTDSSTAAECLNNVGPTTPSGVAVVTKNSGGTVTLPQLRASRTEGVSPLVVQFSNDAADDTQIASNEWAFLGHYIDYGDPTADETYGLYRHGRTAFENGGQGASRERTLGPMGAHVYHCETGICTFNASSAVKNAQGDWAVAGVTITVKSQSAAYPGAHTVCVSKKSDFDGCPKGAARATDLPTLGKWSSHHRYMVRGGESFDVSDNCIQYNVEDIMITSYGGGKAELLGRFHPGADEKCKDRVPSNRAVASFAVDRWIKDITITNVRLGRINLPVTFRDIALHDVDMDFTHSDQYGAGAVNYSSAVYCNIDDSLNCENIRTARGLYISQTIIKGPNPVPGTEGNPVNGDDSARTNLPGANIGVWNYSMLNWLTILDSSVQRACEHNIRTEGVSRVALIYSESLGDHLCDRGLKTGATIRTEGWNNIDCLDAMRPPGLDRSQLCDTRYIYLHDLYFGTPESIGGGGNGISQTKSRDVEVVRNGLVDYIYYDLDGGSGTGSGFYDIGLTGYDLVCYNNSRHNPKSGAKCRDSLKQGGIPDGYYNKAIGTADNLSKPSPPLAPGAY